MTVRGAARSALAIVVLCALCAASGAIALATAQPKHRSRHRASHTARACHRTKRHRHCPPHTTGNHPRRKHRRHASSKPSPKSGSTTASGTTTSGSGSTTTGPASPPAGSGGEVPAGKSPVTPTAPAHVQVTAEDSSGFRFVLSRPTVPSGKVIIEFVNHGQDEHNLNAVEQAEGTTAGSIPNAAPNAHPSLTVNLRPGHYTLFCSLPGHEAAGMKATLVVS